MGTPIFCLLLFLGAVVSTRANPFNDGVMEIRKNHDEAGKCSDHLQYRTFNGKCNNMEHVAWGSEGITYTRLLKSTYDAGLSNVDQSLPSAREVSARLHSSRGSDGRARDEVSLMLMQWWQFLDYDTSRTPTFHIPTNQKCCSKHKSPHCYSIFFLSDDTFIKRYCLPFARSFRFFDDENHQEQINDHTSFIDASNVYGVIKGESDELRSFEGGKLRTEEGFLPPADRLTCLRAKFEGACYLSGDERVNEHPGIALLHTLLVREHNRIAGKLAEVKPAWDDETLFQEARRLLIAIVQKVTYVDFLPLVLPPSALKTIHFSGEEYKYKSTIDATISNSFATAAIRLWHSLFPETVTVGNAELNMKDLWYQPSRVLHNVDQWAKALYTTPSMRSDQAVASALTDHLFQGGDGFGHDAVASAIQRGRDHGLPSYTKFRRHCKLSDRTLQELLDEQVVYIDMDQVDLYSGLLAEPREEGGLVGSTAACILSEQFRRLLEGDRFFYLNAEGPQSFTTDQVSQINTMTLSKLICENSENKAVPTNVFKPLSEDNPIKACDEFPDIDFQAW